MDSTWDERINMDGGDRSRLPSVVWYFGAKAFLREAKGQSRGKELEMWGSLVCGKGGELVIMCQEWKYGGWSQGFHYGSEWISLICYKYKFKEKHGSGSYWGWWIWDTCCKSNWSSHLFIRKVTMLEPLGREVLSLGEMQNGEVKQPYVIYIYISIY